MVRAEVAAGTVGLHVGDRVAPGNVALHAELALAAFGDDRGSTFAAGVLKRHVSQGPDLVRVGRIMRIVTGRAVDGSGVRPDRVAAGPVDETGAVVAFPTRAAIPQIANGVLGVRPLLREDVIGLLGVALGAIAGLVARLDPVLGTVRVRLASGLPDGGRQNVLAARTVAVLTLNVGLSLQILRQGVPIHLLLVHSFYRLSQPFHQ